MFRKTIFHKQAQAWFSSFLAVMSSSRSDNVTQSICSYVHMSYFFNLGAFEANFAVLMFLVFHQCNTTVSPVFQQFYTSVTPVCAVLHQFFTRVLPVFHQCFTIFSPVFQQCFTSFSPMFR